MKIQRQVILDVLSAVKPGLANKEVIEQSNHFIFRDGEVYTYNDEISINHEIDLDFVATVKAKELYELLGKLTEDEIDIELNKDKLKIKSGKTTASLNVDDEIKIPQIEIPDEWYDLPKSFYDGLKFCQFSVGTNVNKYHLTCMKIAGSEIWSCDNHRLTIWVMDDKIDHELMIPGKVTAILTTYDPIEYAIDDSWIHFQNEDGVLFSCRRVNVDYPDLKPLTNVDGVRVALPKDLTGAIDKAGILATEEFDKDRFITMDIAKGSMEVKGEGSLGWVKEKFKIDYDGECSIKIHPNHFNEILSHLDKMVIGENALMFSADNFVHVISLIS